MAAAGVSKAGYAPATGFRKRSSGNREKSLSRVRRSSAAWATQIAAIRASWTTPPVTRGRCMNRPSTARKSLVSPISQHEGDLTQSVSCCQARSCVVAASPQIFRLVTTLRNS